MGILKNQYEQNFKKVPGADFEKTLSQLFKRVSKKYMKQTPRIGFDTGFGILGIFYEPYYPLFVQKVPIYS